jgi:UDP-N-acetyl-D-galactosamine dehydrogenase
MNNLHPFDLHSLNIGVIGLGYVGLPLAARFSKDYPTLGFDIDPNRIDELNQGVDKTLEIETDVLVKADKLGFSRDIEDLRQCNLYIVTVPTPIDEFKRPDLTPLIKASQTIAQVISPGDVVVYESTVYPGATEEICVPVIEKSSDLVFNQDFFVGYSPERINPGDKQHTLDTIIKITSGSTPEVADFIDRVYASIIRAGTHLASSIKVAEAAKVIENTQRDLNIALINELAVIFSKLDINTEEVLQAAGTKWNFLPFRPGLVGGHCIGVDPYYLTHKAQQMNYHPQVILSGRRINDGMGHFVVKRLVKAMIEKRIHIVDAKVLILGFTFKENCPDVRNTRIIDIVQELHDYSAHVDVYDPWADAHVVKQVYDLDLVTPQAEQYDAIIIAVAHDKFKQYSMADMRHFGKKGALVFDLKYLFPAAESDLRL